MRARQIILANEPRLLRSMLCRVFGKVPALQVAEVGDLAQLSSLVDNTDAQWVIVSLTAQGRIPAKARSLLHRHPALGVVGIAEDGSLVRIQGAGRADTDASPLSLEELVATLCRQPALSARSA